MSDEHGRHITVRTARRTSGSPKTPKTSKTPRERPSFDRPSLFARYDNADVEDADIQRVHILSTLESERRSPQKGLKSRRQAGAAGTNRFGNWQPKALIALMGLGIVALVAAFVLLVKDHAGTPQPLPASLGQAGQPAQQARKPIPADTRNPLAALAAHPAKPPAPLPPEEQAAVIENLPADPMPPVAAPPSHLPAAQALADKALHQVDPIARARQALPSDTLAAMPSVAPPANRRVGKPDVLPAPPPALAPLSSDPSITVTSDKTLSKPVANTAPKRPRADKDEDVALLEAVMAHSSTRKPPPAPPTPAVSVTEELQRCASLTGGAAATCRARICVQQPSAPACHPEP